MLSVLLCVLALLSAAFALSHAPLRRATRPVRLSMVGGFGWKATTPSKDIVVRVDGKSIACAEPGNLRKILQANKVDVYPLLAKFNNCGGGGVCGTCAVKVLDGMQNLSPASKNEQKVLLENKRSSDIRLSCCAKVNGPVSIKTKP